MSNAFNMDLRAQQEWSWLLAIWLFLGGSGSGLYVLYLALGLPPLYGAAALGLILVGGLDLLAELGNPFRAWRVVFRAGTSWLSRGALSVALFVILAALSVLPRLGLVPGLAAVAQGSAGVLLGWLAGLCAVVIMLYPAFFFRSTGRAVPFWNTPLLPLLFVGYALTGGVGAVLLRPSSGGPAAPIVTLAVALVVLEAAMIALHVSDMRRAGGAGRESVRRLTTGLLGALFSLGVVLAGLVLPLIVLLAFPAASPVAGAGLLVGGFLFRACLLKAGVYVAPSIVPAGLDLSKLNRTSADFEREYAGMTAPR